MALAVQNLIHFVERLRFVAFNSERALRVHFAIYMCTVCLIWYSLIAVSKHDIAVRRHAGVIVRRQTCLVDIQELAPVGIVVIVVVQELWDIELLVLVVVEGTCADADDIWHIGIDVL